MEVDSGTERNNFGVKTSVCKCWAGITQSDDINGNLIQSDMF